MKKLQRFVPRLALATVAVAGLSLVASGCCHRKAHAYAHHMKMMKFHHGKGGCGKGGMGGCDSKAKKHSLGAPKLLCPKKLVVHAKMLGLSEDQVTKLKALGKEHKTQMADFMLQMKRAKLALKAEWLKDQPDAGQIRSLAKALWAVKQAKLDAKAEFLIKAKEVLTAEQYKKILTKSVMGHHKGHGKGGPCGCGGGCSKGGCGKGGMGGCDKGGCGKGGCCPCCGPKGGKGGCGKGGGCPCCGPGRPGPHGPGGPGAGGPGPDGPGPHPPCPTCVH